MMDLIDLAGSEKSACRGIGRGFCCGSDVWWRTDDNHVEDSDILNRGIGKQYVTVQEHERGRVRLGQNDCLQGKKEIRKESSDLS
jgi:hypothetical protein